MLQFNIFTVLNDTSNAFYSNGTKIDILDYGLSEFFIREILKIIHRFLDDNEDKTQLIQCIFANKSYIELEEEINGIEYIQNFYKKNLKDKMKSLDDTQTKDTRENNPTRFEATGADKTQNSFFKTKGSDAWMNKTGEWAKKEKVKMNRTAGENDPFYRVGRDVKRKENIKGSQGGYDIGLETKKEINMRKTTDGMFMKGRREVVKTAAE